MVAQDPLGAGAHLAGIEQRGVGHRFRRDFGVGIVGHDEGILPPSSMCSFFIMGAARLAMRWPVARLPVKAITGTRG